MIKWCAAIFILLITLCRITYRTLVYLMRITVNDGLFLEFQFARILAAAFDSHGAIVITINLANDDIVYGCCDFAPLKGLPIFKLEGEYPHGIKLNGSTPKFPFQIRICPEFPASSITVTSDYHWMVTDLNSKIYHAGFKQVVYKKAIQSFQVSKFHPTPNFKRTNRIPSRRRSEGLYLDTPLHKSLQEVG